MNRKKYNPPKIQFENLSLNTDLTTCSIIVNFSEYICPVLIPEIGQTVFQDNNCDWTNDDFYVCYHVPNSAINIFSS